MIPRSLMLGALIALACVLAGCGASPKRVDCWRLEPINPPAPMEKDKTP